MSGHNKWSQIKEKKGKEDAARSKLFSQHAKNIALESKKAKGDKNTPGLKAAIERAKAANVPNDNIERAVERGSGKGGMTLEEVTYETYGPGGIAIIIEGLTDNKNRTTPEIKHLLSQIGLALGGQGSSTWAFERNGSEWQAKTKVPLSPADKERLAEIVEEIENHEDVRKVYTNLEGDESLGS